MIRHNGGMVQWGCSHTPKGGPLAKRKYKPQINHGWTISNTVVAPSGRHLTPGTELKIEGQRGRFRFRQYVDTGKAQWIDVFDKDGRCRSFRLDRVRTVHRTTRLRGAAR